MPSSVCGGCVAYVDTEDGVAIIDCGLWSGGEVTTELPTEFLPCLVLFVVGVSLSIGSGCTS